MAIQMASLLTEGWPKSVSFFSACACTPDARANSSAAMTVLMVPPLGQRNIGHVARQHTIDRDPEQAVEYEPDHADGQERDEDAVGLQQDRRLLQQEADAGVRGQDLGRDDAHEG